MLHKGSMNIVHSDDEGGSVEEFTSPDNSDNIVGLLQVHGDILEEIYPRGCPCLDRFEPEISVSP